MGKSVTVYSGFKVNENWRRVTKGRYAKDFLDFVVDKVSGRSGFNKQSLTCRLLLLGLVNDPNFSKYFGQYFREWRSAKLSSGDSSVRDLVDSNVEFIKGVLGEDFLNE